MGKVTSKPKTKIKVNFAGVETRAHVPDGLYHSRVHEASLEEGAQAPYIKWTFELMDPDLKGRKVYTNTSLAPQALWNLRNLLDTLGIETPDSEFELDLKSYADRELMLRIENEVYEGKERPKVTDYTPLEGETAVENDEKSDDGDEEEEEEETEEEEEESDDEKETEEEEEAKLTADEIREMDEAELKDLVKKHGLKVDFAKITKPGKRIAAVIDAMESAKLLADE